MDNRAKPGDFSRSNSPTRLEPLGSPPPLPALHSQQPTAAQPKLLLEQLQQQQGAPRQLPSELAVPMPSPLRVAKLGATRHPKAFVYSPTAERIEAVGESDEEGYPVLVMGMPDQLQLGKAFDMSPTYRQPRIVGNPRYRVAFQEDNKKAVGVLENILGYDELNSYSAEHRGEGTSRVQWLFCPVWAPLLGLFFLFSWISSFCCCKNPKHAEVLPNVHTERPRAKDIASSSAALGGGMAVGLAGTVMAPHFTPTAPAAAPSARGTVAHMLPSPQGTATLNADRVMPFRGDAATPEPQGGSNAG